MDSKKRHIAILGSTGSIGTQALEVIKANPELFQAEVLTAGNNAELLISQAKEFSPNCVVIGDEKKYQMVLDALDPLDIKVYAGEKAIASVVEMEQIDMVLTAMVGFAGLQPTFKAIRAGKAIALANKETLVVAGGLIMDEANEKNIPIIPVDSEHSAIFQCLSGETYNPIEKIILTASGGPFRGKKRNELKNIRKEDALKHPNWDMGAKITIDSSTMMNKGLEVIEAKWLFNLKPEQIDVIVHPQSIIHSMVQFTDGSMKAQMGLPDMKLPIQYALAFPQRIPSDFPRYDFTQPSQLDFEKPDLETFKNLQLAYEAMKKGGNAPCILNAANEIAVEEFLKENIQFLEIPALIERCLENVGFIQNPGLEELFATDKETRVKGKELLKNKKSFSIAVD